ncbi:unnamed protein product [Brachionus calyciflorus]|uniref:mannose-6-phosphate isomerase n=1 Tax=Brachionus calyciflorus TaxID=104777 RepID=A0A813Y3Y9_9BILA|nr:unnamed protein product [Brachionus calyciflorus]
MTEPNLEEIQNIENLLVNPSHEKLEELKQKFLTKLCEEFKVDLSEFNGEMAIIKTQITALQTLKMHRLNCGVQKYGWGRRGRDSKVALFKQSQDPSFTITDSETYAELWMGTHSNCPSKINNTELLSDYIKSNPQQILGDKIVEHFYTKSDTLKTGDLPFLFKVLSINQALSIQAHPNKTLAAQLNKNDPKNYPDSNHKPEMLISISENFQALCGFRPIEEILTHLENYPELKTLCQGDHGLSSEKNEKNLKLCFSAMMNQSDSIVSEQLNLLKKRLESSSNRSDLENLFLDLDRQYSNDVGCFSIFLLNLIHMKKGEAIYLSANIPHAYLYGDGVECMACSDNVVRAGLTPKFKDVGILCEMLDYSMKSSEENKLNGFRVNNFMIDYKPSVDEFSVQVIKIDNSEVLTNGRLEIPSVQSGSILIVTEASEGLKFECNGESFEVKEGYVYFIECDKEINLTSESENCVLNAFRAYCDIKN